MGCGIPERTVPEGFPPVALYALTDQPEHPAGIVASGPHPIYYPRWVVEPGDIYRVVSPGTVWNSHYGDRRDHLRFEYLAMLLQMRLEDVEFDSKPARSIRWSGPAEFLQEVELVCSQVLKQYDGLVERLEAYGLLTQSEAEKLNARVHLRVNDLRADKSMPLPEIAMARVVVEQ
jgi:hypothetical protein